MLESQVWWAVLSGAIAMMAQYIPARLGIPIGGVVALLAAWKLGLTDFFSWQFWVVLFLFALAGLRVCKEVRNRRSTGINTDVSESPLVMPDNTTALPDYSEQWGHFAKINDALIKLQSASLEQVSELTGIIQHERVYLDDSLIQSALDALILDVDQWAKLGVPPDGLLIPRIISNLSNRMHKRYRRT